MKTVMMCSLIGLILLATPLTAPGAKSGPQMPVDPRALTADRPAGAPVSSDIEKPDPADREDFDRGYRLYKRGKYRQACRYLFRYISRRTPDDTDYEWAEFFFGISLKKLGYSHAAIDILTHLVTRKPNQKIVRYSLELFEQALRTLPVEHEALINRVLCDQEYGFLDGTVADFVNYHQGLFDWEHGFFQWGDQHFSQIAPDTHYYYQYLYQKALLALFRDQLTDATELLRQILRGDQAQRQLQDEARKTLARLLYEQQKFEEADFMYAQIRRSILQQAENLLERAWAEYRLGNLEKAMGLLYAFEAPSFRNAFKPEYFILKSFIYKDVCHYDRALAVIEEFKARYGVALEIIYSRQAAGDNHKLMLYLLNKKQIQRTWQFLELLEREKAACDRFKDKDLRIYLEKLYDLQIKQSRNRLRRQIEAEYEKVANDLLQYEENAHLMEYEIGLDMYKRVYEAHYREDPGQPKASDSTRRAVFPFQGEFWNDELADYQVTLPNKCQDIEEWDIFFE
jgi:TolA-binding protein